MRLRIRSGLSLLNLLVLASSFVAKPAGAFKREETSDEDFLIITESGEDDKVNRMGRGFEAAGAAATPADSGNNPIAERQAAGGGCLPICTPGDCLPICTPGAKNTTVAPTNGTTALPRAFLRKLIQAGYRVVPPAKYGGPPEQAMAFPGARNYGMPPRPPQFPQQAPFMGQSFPGYPPAPAYRQRPSMQASANGYPQFGVQLQRQPGAPPPPPPPPAMAYPPRGYPPAPQLPPPAIIGYPGAPRYPPPPMGYPQRFARRHRQISNRDKMEPIPYPYGQDVMLPMHPQQQQDFGFQQYPEK